MNEGINSLEPECRLSCYTIVLRITLRKKDVESAKTTFFLKTELQEEMDRIEQKSREQEQKEEKCE
jgi:hypothetical protein